MRTMARSMYCVNTSVAYDSEPVAVIANAWQRGEMRTTIGKHSDNRGK